MASSSGVPVLQQGQTDAELMFTLYSDAVLVMGFYRGGVRQFDTNVLKAPLALWDCDGVTLKAGDDKIYVRDSELSGFVPTAGDQFGYGGGTWNVIAASLNLSRTVWTCFARRQ